MQVYQTISQQTIPSDEIDWDAIITENDTPVDNYKTEHQYPLLTVPVNDNFVHSIHGKRFIVASDVGVFSAPKEPPIVPDVFLSLGLQIAPDQSQKRNRSYFIWETGKPPEVVIEIVSNQEGGEDSAKLVRYARIGVKYYAIYDPLHELSDATLRFFVLRDRRYVEVADTWMPEVEMGLALWQGEYRGYEDEWLRWCDKNGQVIPTSAELFSQERVRSERAIERAEQERERAEQEREQQRERAQRLAARLAALGVTDVD